MQRLIAASAILSGRLVCQRSDLWVLRHVWDLEEQIEILNGLVNEVIGDAADESNAHPGVEVVSKIDANALAANLETLQAALKGGESREGLEDQLAALEGQVEWVENEVARAALEGDCCGSLGRAEGRARMSWVAIFPAGTLAGPGHVAHSSAGGGG